MTTDLRAVEWAAWPGPWIAHRGSGGVRPWVHAARGAFVIADTSSHLDADLIADFRNAAPLLLDVAHRARLHADYGLPETYRGLRAALDALRDAGYQVGTDD